MFYDLDLPFQRLGYCENAPHMALTKYYGDIYDALTPVASRGHRPPAGMIATLAGKKLSPLLDRFGLQEDSNSKTYAQFETMFRPLQYAYRVYGDEEGGQACDNAMNFYRYMLAKQD